MGVWSGAIGLKAKDWGGMGISVPGGMKVTVGLTQTLKFDILKETQGEKTQNSRKKLNNSGKNSSF